MKDNSGYKPRHKGIIETDFCINGCVIVDGVKVPFPDCWSHGNPLYTDPKCVILEVPPLKS